jgi:predicted transcriptional regulator
VEQLLEKCVAKMTYTKGISRNQIFETIQSLEEKKWIVTGQRRTLQEVLNTSMNKKILKLINDNPGIHARSPEIEAKLGITRTPFLKHIIILEKFGSIRSKKIGASLNYFIYNVPETYDELIVKLSSPLVNEIICEFLNNNEPVVYKIAKKFNVYHGTIQYHIKKLEKEGIFRKVGTKYEINTEILSKINDFGYNSPNFPL